MSQRVYNFNPGPSSIPLSVLQKAQAELLNYNNTGMSVMELSHRSKDFEAIIKQAESKMKSLLQLTDDYRVLFLQGGASLQFSMIPLNFLKEGQEANYLITGAFADKAMKEAALIGSTHIAASSKDQNYNYIPSIDHIQLSDHPAYLHITTNNTIFGTQCKHFPEFTDIPLIADMSSDILSRSINANKFSLIYAGAQKNLGPSGVTVVILHKSLLEKCNQSLPTMLRYDIMAKNDSMYNTPPTFGIYLLDLMLDWIQEQGGVTTLERHNQEKAKYIYDVIDNSNGFYKGHALPEFRSNMNITFTLANPELEQEFIASAAKRNIVGIKGHRSVGGMRASVYNAMEKEGCMALAEFMEEFRKNH